DVHAGSRIGDDDDALEEVIARIGDRLQELLGGDMDGPDQRNAAEQVVPNIHELTSEHGLSQDAGNNNHHQHDENTETGDIVTEVADEQRREDTVDGTEQK